MSWSLVLIWTCCCGLYMYIYICASEFPFQETMATSHLQGIEVSRYCQAFGTSTTILHAQVALRGTSPWWRVETTRLQQMALISVSLKKLILISKHFQELHCFNRRNTLLAQENYMVRSYHTRVMSY
jgi:hypothetical protein